MEHLTHHVPIERVNAAGGAQRMDDTVVREHLLAVCVEGAPVLRMACTPAELRELVVGHLYSGGVIMGLDDIVELRVDEDLSAVHLTLAPECFTSAACVPTETAAGLPQPAPVALRYGRRAPAPLPPLPCPNSTVWALERAFAKGSPLFATTGAVHCAIVWARGQIWRSFYDIGRHNALDKAIGAALLEGLALTRCVLFTSGRLPADMVQKTIMAGVPALVSRSAPTDRSLALARQYGLTVVGFVKPDRFSRYT